MKIIIYIILIGVIVLLCKFLLPKFKSPKIGSVALVTGAIKGGKSSFAFVLAYRQYKRALFNWRVRSFFQRLFHKKVDEKPLFYSNIPLDINYCLLNQDIIERKNRIRFKSCTFIDECSLLADSQLYKDQVINEELMLFTKLYGHSSHGGTMVINTQSYNDLHYSMSRCISQVFYVHHTTKWLPFIAIAWVRELIVDTNDNTVNVFNEDTEETLKPYIYLKKYWKKYDTYAFSDFTDNLPVYDNVVRSKDLKVKKLISFRDFKTLKKECNQNVSNKN